MTRRHISDAVRREAQAFCIWSYATARDWDLTLRELAEALDLKLIAVRNTCNKRGWSRRLRSDTQDHDLSDIEDGAPDDIMAALA
ncbi:hypothetical protein [Falsirhodobacter halotolerans]|uniref:hypothetical protein n=1 Tax=Falsirhodobacter halotolerans TaxID=1146892 RepID=UPI001FD2A0EA|nr:hypothetical protein [Falsirhodobacter halotolerans]MCJ8139493.1 hypothetical protein [Falsirhodobacter halotolerans]